MMYRTPTRYTLLFTAIIFLASCGGSSDDEAESTTDASTTTDDSTDVGGNEDETTDDGSAGTVDDSSDDEDGTDDTGTDDMGTDDTSTDDTGTEDPDTDEISSDSPDGLDDTIEDDGTDENTDLSDQALLRTASRVFMLDTFDTAIDAVSQLAVNPEFTGQNFQEALLAIDEGSRSRLIFQRARFLALLETQTQLGTSNLDFLNITEDGFNRVHICPDGGRLLSVKADDSAETDQIDLTGTYLFQECSIGDIFIDGGYTSDETQSATARIVRTFTFNDLLINGSGVDDIVTTLNGFYQNDIRVSDDNNGGEILTATSTDNSSVSISSFEGVLNIISAAITVETAGDASVDVQEPPAAEGRNVQLRRVSLSVEDEPFVFLTAISTTNLAQTPEGTTFEQGEVELTLNGSPNRLRLQAANGDPATYDVFILQQDNSVVSFNQSWTDTERDFGSRDRLPELLIPR